MKQRELASPPSSSVQIQGDLEDIGNLSLDAPSSDESVEHQAAVHRQDERATTWASQEERAQCMDDSKLKSAKVSPIWGLTTTVHQTREDDGSTGVENVQDCLEVRASQQAHVGPCIGL